MKVTENWLDVTSYLLMFLFIILVIPLHLFPCFLSGFLTYEIIVSLTPYLEKIVGIGYARKLVVMIITICIAIAVIIGIVSFISFLMLKIQHNININLIINNIFSNIKHIIPSYILSFLPKNNEVIKEQLITLFESNIITIRHLGHTFIHSITTIFIGLIIGILISLNKKSNNKTYFIKQLINRIYYLSQSFRKIVFAQIKVSLVNTTLTALMILGLIKVVGVHIPLSKTLLIITFIFGLLPIVGNLISNFMIIISALSISWTIGGLMFFYLILIHKLEYFLNAEIVGNCINAKSWELLFAMLLLEAVFGLEGLVAAPIYYAYLKTELRICKII